MRLLHELEPRHRVFLRNLADVLLFRGGPRAHTPPSDGIWRDVFIDAHIAPRSLVQSALWHMLALVAIYGWTTAYVPQVSQANLFRNAEITYYNVSEYLPAVNSGSRPAPKASKGQPAYAKQEVISLPPNPDNSRQTIVDPSTDKILRTSKPLPNIVAWAAPSPSVPVTGLAHSSISLPTPDLSVIAPTVQPLARDLAQMRKLAGMSDAVGPAAEVTSRDMSKLNLKLPSPGAVEPVASVDVQRKLGDLNIAAAVPSVAEPKLPVAEQRSSGAGGAPGGTQSASEPGPPALATVGGRQASGRLIALGLDPVTPAGPIEMPGGNRRGAFAAGPEGKPGAPGTPDIAAGGTGAGGHGTGDAGAGRGGPSDIPAGIYVAGKGNNSMAAVVASPTPPPGPSPSSPARTAASVPRTLPTLPKNVMDIARQTVPGVQQPITGKIEDEVFGPKRYYTMSLNMANLTSGSGTWIIRFAELNESKDKTELTAPVAVRKVDPAYPPELMRENVEGTVTLYAVIHADGTVGEVKVLRGVDQRLDENAKTALSRWQFHPGTKHGDPIELEAVVQIPFKLRRITF